MIPYESFLEKWFVLAKNAGAEKRDTRSGPSIVRLLSHQLLSL